MKMTIGLTLAFVIGAACRYFDIPAPAPNALLGAALVFAVTLGYWCVGHFLM